MGYGCVLVSPRVTFCDDFCYFFGVGFPGGFWDDFVRDFCMSVALVVDCFFVFCAVDCKHENINLDYYTLYFKHVGFFAKADF